VCGLAAFALVLGRFQQSQCADSLIPVLASLQHWTPFFWGQDRIGMLVPLLASPLTNPLLNLVVQNSVYVFGLLAAFLLLPRYLRTGGSSLLVGLVSIIAFLTLAPVQLCFDFTATTFYGVWLALGLGALVLAAEARAGWPWARLILALVLLILAHWVYAGAALVLAPLVLIRCFTARPAERGSFSTGQFCLFRSDTSVSLLLLAVGFRAGRSFMHWAPEVYPYGRTKLDWLPLANWPGVWCRLAVNSWKAQVPYHWPYFLGATAAFGLCLVMIPAVRPRALSAWRTAAAIVAVALLYVLFLGTQKWIDVNACNYRYTLPAVFLVQGAIVMAGTAPAIEAMSRRLRRGLTLLAAFAIPLVATGGDVPSVQDLRVLLDRSLGTCTQDVISARCTHIAGNYWQVWPAVYHTNLVLRDKGESRMVWGLSGRCEPSRFIWEKLPFGEWRIAVPVNQGSDAAAVAAYFHFPPSEQCRAYPELPGHTERLFAYLRLPPLVVVEKLPTIWVVCPRPASMTLQGKVLCQTGEDTANVVTSRMSCRSRKCSWRWRVRVNRRALSGFVAMSSEVVEQVGARIGQRIRSF
jgi:hypothetical protein